MADAHACAKRNSHNRSFEDINKVSFSIWFLQCCSKVCSAFCWIIDCPLNNSIGLVGSNPLNKLCLPLDPPRLVSEFRGVHCWLRQADVNCLLAVVHVTSSARAYSIARAICFIIARATRFFLLTKSHGSLAVAYNAIHRLNNRPLYVLCDVPFLLKANACLLIARDKLVTCICSTLQSPPLLSESVFFFFGWKLILRTNFYGVNVLEGWRERWFLWRSSLILVFFWWCRW